MNRVRMAQLGTGHGHAAGKMRSMRSSDQVEVAGVCEPDEEERRGAESNPVYEGLRWYETAEEMLGDDSIDAVASEGRNSQSLDQTGQIVAAGKHVWYDKPAGDDYGQWQRVLDRAREQGLHVQMGYMLRYNPIFARVTEWARSGFLGDVFAVRAHMSTSVPAEARERIAEAHAGGVHYDLAGHMLDLIVWMLGRPTRVTTFLRNDTGQVPAFSDNTLGVYEFEKAIAMVDIAAMETAPMARRFEVYGTKGSAIIVEPFEPAPRPAALPRRGPRRLPPGRAAPRGRGPRPPELLRPRTGRLPGDDRRRPGAGPAPGARAAGAGDAHERDPRLNAGPLPAPAGRSTHRGGCSCRAAGSTSTGSSSPRAKPASPSSTRP